MYFAFFRQMFADDYTLFQARAAWIAALLMSSGNRWDIKGVFYE